MEQNAKKCKNSITTFRSWVLRVMSPARYALSAKFLIFLANRDSYLPLRHDAYQMKKVLLIYHYILKNNIKGL